MVCDNKPNTTTTRSWPIRISHPAEGRRLSWPEWLAGYTPRWYSCERLTNTALTKHNLTHVCQTVTPNPTHTPSPSAYTDAAVVVVRQWCGVPSLKSLVKGQQRMRFRG